MLLNFEYASLTEKTNSKKKSKAPYIYSAKLTKIKVKNIKNKYSMGNISYRKLAKKYKVSYETIRLVVHNKYKLS